MTWTLEPARTSFDRHAKDWDGLNREHGSHILFDSRFVSGLVRHFATPTTIVATSTRTGRRAIALLDRGGMGFVSTFQPSQSPLGLLLLESKDIAVPMMRELMRRLPGFPLGISILHQDPDHTFFPMLGPDPASANVPYIETGRIRLQGTFQDYWKSRSKNLTHNLGRQRRRLAEEGKALQLRVVRDPGRVADCVATYGRLEGSGWKAEQGTAVAADNPQGNFYREMFEGFLSSGEGTIFQLDLDGRVIASDLCLERDGMMVILKTAYDGGTEGLSPGLLLHQEILEYCFATDRIRLIEFYGRARDWHRKWTQDFRGMYHVNLYRAAWAARAHTLARRGLGLLKRARAPRDTPPGAGPAPDPT